MLPRLGDGDGAGDLGPRRLIKTYHLIKCLGDLGLRSLFQFLELETILPVLPC